jgi:hypothetical protein
MPVTTEDYDKSMERPDEEKVAMRALLKYMISQSDFKLNKGKTNEVISKAKKVGVDPDVTIRIYESIVRELVDDMFKKPE